MSESGRPDGLPGPRQARRTEDFDALYAAGTPAWDIGRPQPAFVELAERGRLVGRILDVGCGTGEHALMAGRPGTRRHRDRRGGHGARGRQEEGRRARDQRSLRGMGCSRVGVPRGALRHSPRLRSLSRLRGRRSAAVRRWIEGLAVGGRLLLHVVLQRPPTGRLGSPSDPRRRDQGHLHRRLDGRSDRACPDRDNDRSGSRIRVAGSDPSQLIIR